MRAGGTGNALKGGAAWLHVLTHVDSLRIAETDSGSIQTAESQPKRGLEM
jgi:hypothetical protein